MLLIRNKKKKKKRERENKRRTFLTLPSMILVLILWRKRTVEKTLWKKVESLNMSNFTFFHNDYYAICVFMSFISHISGVVCNFFEFGTISKWNIREWINNDKQPNIYGLRVLFSTLAVYNSNLCYLPTDYCHFQRSLFSSRRVPFLHFLN